VNQRPADEAGEALLTFSWPHLQFHLCSSAGKACSRCFCMLTCHDSMCVASGPSVREARKWKEGRDLWCEKCRVQYCLYCGDSLGSLVRYHVGQTCAQFLQATEHAKIATAHQRSVDAVTAECGPRLPVPLSAVSLPHAHILVISVITTMLSCNRALSLLTSWRALSTIAGAWWTCSVALARRDTPAQ
jgi:hypothetical protein